MYTLVALHCFANLGPLELHRPYKLTDLLS